MLVALSADMEGVSQLGDWRAIFAFERAYWREGRAQMEAEVAAAARGLLTGGADEVVVLDNHASGNPINIRAESLPARARLETWDVFELRDRGVDALLQVGYHSRAGLDAFVAHTYVPELVLYVDGEPISESHGRAWAAGVPLLGICGNDVHGRTLGSLGDVPYLVAQRTSSTVDARTRRDSRRDRAICRGRRALGRSARALAAAGAARRVRASRAAVHAGHCALGGRPAADRRRDGGSDRSMASLYHPLRSDE